jgi:hypothetical protein
LRRYGAIIERALASWEVSPEEWADYIAFLARLLKAIQSHPKGSPFLPHSSAIATRLAQCLNPTLPSGVHQKALEVYNYIFDSFGDHFIAGHLHEYLPGLAGVLSFASLSVRPGLYYLLEEHIITLEAVDLRPALKSLVLSLLPALEEESGEDFERAFGILQNLESSFDAQAESEDTKHGDGYFWQSLFLAVITSPSRRQGALNYLVRRLPRLSAGNTDDLDSKLARIVMPEPGLLIRCFICGLSDNQILIQRGFLDLLVARLPLDSPVLQKQVGDDDLDKLVSAALQILLRRDMGLNRRLWSWFLGPENKDVTDESQTTSPTRSRNGIAEANFNSQIEYYASFGQPSLQRCVLGLLDNKSMKASERARPFRICLSLMDRWEIGGQLVPHVFMPAMRSLRNYSLNATPEATAEVVRSASLFFDGVEANLIWGSLVATLHEGLEQNHIRLRKEVEFVRWVTQTFNIKDEEMVTLHIPQMLNYILSCVDVHAYVPETNIALCMFAAQLLDFIRIRPTTSMISVKPEATSAASHLNCSAAELRSSVVRYYAEPEQPRDTAADATKNSEEVLEQILAQCDSIASTSLAKNQPDVLSLTTSMIISIINKVEAVSIERLKHLLPAIARKFDPLTGSAPDTVPFAILNSSVSLLFALRPSGKATPNSSTSVLTNVGASLTNHLWYNFSPARAKHHVEAVKCLWLLEGTLSAETMVASLAALIRSPSQAAEVQGEEQIETLRRFAVLWNHTMVAPSTKAGSIRRKSSTASTIGYQKGQQNEVLWQPMMLILDLLSDPSTPASECVKTWLQGLPSLDQVLQYLLDRLHETLPSTSVARSINERQRTRQLAGEIRELNYLLGLIRSILSQADYWTWQCLNTIMVPIGTTSEPEDGLSVLANFCSQLLFSSIHRSDLLNRHLIDILGYLLSSPLASSLRKLQLETTLISCVSICITGESTALQGELLRLLSLALKLRTSKAPGGSANKPRLRGSISSKTPIILNSPSTTSLVGQALPSGPPTELLQCLLSGFAANSTRHYLDHWITFLGSTLPLLTDVIFTYLIPLVECFCLQLSKAYDELISLSRKSNPSGIIAPDSAIIHLLEGLEMILDRAYESLVQENAQDAVQKPTDAASGFLSNVTSGVFKLDGPTNKTSKANNRLTVILALHDAIRVILKMWIWASRPVDHQDSDPLSVATITYNALKVRNKTRHLLEQIYTVEPLESLEVIATHWCRSPSDSVAVSTIDLLHVMQVSQPKAVVPTILDALYSRTNPASLTPARMSSQTVELSASEVAIFLSAYLRSTEDDATDEIWTDCISFLRDVLANPLPYRQALPHLLSVLLLLAEKLDNTNYGEQRKMRRELGDIFQRLLTATFTTLPSGYITEYDDKDGAASTLQPIRLAVVQRSLTLVSVLDRITAHLEMILETPERMLPAITSISTSLVAPTFKAKSFPKNVDPKLLSLLVHVAQKAPASKPWKKDVADAFNDPRFLSVPSETFISDWSPVLHQYSLYDKERMPELLARLLPPSTAGLMFGVGASAARLEADRKTQLNLRRLCLLMLASPQDTHVTHLAVIFSKIAELFEASASSSPSITIKSELFMLCRALALSFRSIHLAPLWPIVNDKLQAALNSMLPGSAASADFNNLALLQSCKLLDLLIALSLDDFQPHEWLYITDTTDAVHQPSHWSPVALADHVAAALDANNVNDGNTSAYIETENATNKGNDNENSASNGGRKALLSDSLVVDNGDIKAWAKEDFTSAVLRPFLNQLSIHAYEDVYGLEAPDVEAMRRGLLGDLLDPNTIVE